jgi:hypothetical protein
VWPADSTGSTLTSLLSRIGVLEPVSANDNTRVPDLAKVWCGFHLRLLIFHHSAPVRPVTDMPTGSVRQ